MNYILSDAQSGERLSVHPNPEGAKLSALFHVPNRSAVMWEPVGRADTLRGTLNGLQRFLIYPEEA